LAPSGLMLRGGFHPQDSDEVPALGNGAAAGTVFMVGNAGPAMWRAFSAYMGDYSDSDDADPLNQWTKLVLDAAAAKLGFEPLYPFGSPPYWPVQRWALRTGLVMASPIGILIDPEYGLWHAYRAALLLEERLDLPAPIQKSSPCESCAARPCLATCPVSAFQPDGYDAVACADHVLGAAGEDCLKGGCLARHACPVGQEHAYTPVQAEFHMMAFASAVKAH
jgi:hypothetical protein